MGAGAGSGIPGIAVRPRDRPGGDRGLPAKGPTSRSGAFLDDRCGSVGSVNISIDGTNFYDRGPCSSLSIQNLSEKTAVQPPRGELVGGVYVPMCLWCAEC